MAHGLTLSEVASIVAKLKMYPYFDVANYILMSMMVREDAHPPPTSGIAWQIPSIFSNKRQYTDGMGQ